MITMDQVDANPFEGVVAIPFFLLLFPLYFPQNMPIFFTYYSSSLDPQTLAERCSTEDHTAKATVNVYYFSSPRLTSMCRHWMYDIDQLVYGEGVKNCCRSARAREICSFSDILFC